jgi:hypothetical protein
MTSDCVILNLIQEKAILLSTREERISDCVILNLI